MSERSMEKTGHAPTACRRDASWFAYPGTAEVYHICLSGYVSACNPAGMPLYEASEQLAVTIPIAIRCKRSGCKSRWPAEVLRGED